jgi:hypothetical protein
MGTQLFIFNFVPNVRCFNQSLLLKFYNVNDPVLLIVYTGPSYGLFSLSEFHNEGLAPAVGTIISI